MDAEYWKTRCKQLEKRLKHLLQSNLIRSFDEWDKRKGGYKRDIREADTLYTERNVITARTILEFGDVRFVCRMCSNVMDTRQNYCEYCGQKLRGKKNVVRRSNKA